MSREEERDEDQQISSLREWAEEATEDTDKEEVSGRDSQETLREEAAEAHSDNEALAVMAEAGAGSMLEIAARLAEQRDLIKAAVVTMQQKKTLSDQAVESVIAAAVTTQQREGGVRRCPMCEATFPEQSTTQVKSIQPKVFCSLAIFRNNLKVMSWITSPMRSRTL